MPAISLARLNKQTARLIDEFHQPGSFISTLRDMLEFYADRTQRPSQSGEPKVLLATYNTPAQILKHLIQELKPLAQADPYAGMAICDALWTESSYECRLLAATLLGELPINNPKEILDRLTGWLINTEALRLRQMVLTRGLAQIWKRAQGPMLTQISAWLAAKQPAEQQLGLMALQVLTANRDYENLPAVFKLTIPLLREIHPELRPDLESLLVLLARRSPGETAYLLRHALTQTENLAIHRLVRRMIENFPVETRDSLKAAIKSKFE